MKSKYKTRDKVCDLIKDDGSLTISARDKAEVLNSFLLVSSQKNLAYIPVLPNRNFVTEFSLFKIRTEDMLKALNASRSAGPDGIQYKFLLELKDSLCVPITHI